MSPENVNLAEFIAELNYMLGLNTAHDYDGVITNEDTRIYRAAIIRKINKLLVKEKENYKKPTIHENNLNILEKANRIIFGREQEQQRQYGPLSEGIEKTARIASEFCNKDFTAQDVFKILIALKMSRLAHAYKEDSALDAIGYLAGLHDYEQNK